MAQTFTEDSFASGHVGQTDLQNMENNFMALKTLFSGSSAPSDSTGGMPWFDTGKKLLKIRNSTNGAWLGVLSATTAPRFWVYANAAEDGWIVDSSVTDRVIAIKGGSAAYNASGGTGQGTWTISGISTEAAHTHAMENHVHQWFDYVAGSSHSLYNSAGTTVSLGSVGVAGSSIIGMTLSSEGGFVLGADAYTKLQGSSVNTGAGSAHTHTQNAAWRPAAAVGTVQYLGL